MATNLTYGFYNAVESGGVYDREYTAEQLSAIFDGVITDGVYATIGDCFHVKVSSGFNLLIGTGRAWFEHTWSYNPATDNSITLSTPDVSYDRIDAVVLRIDSDNRTNSFYVIEGNLFNQDEYDPSIIIPDAERPALGDHDHPLAYIRIRHNTEGIQGVDSTGDSTDIENAIGVHERTPWVTAILSSYNASGMIAQWKAAVLQELDYLESLITQVEDEGALSLLDLKPVVGYDVTVPTTAWSEFIPSPNTEEAKIAELGYTYRAFMTDASLATVIIGMRPYITWSLSSIDAAGADILNQYQCTVVNGVGGVYIYADSVPEEAILALTVECRHPIEELT